jgi:hypothetical protein
MARLAARVQKVPAKKAADITARLMAHRAVIVHAASDADQAATVLQEPDRMRHIDMARQVLPINPKKTIRRKTPFESLSLAPGERVSGPSQHVPRVASKREFVRLPDVFLSGWADNSGSLDGTA